jgi:anhydro-N-acetylmuramic acid kinase
LVLQLEAYFGKTLRTTAELAVNPDAKEAVLFALLANEAVAGENGAPGIYMGKVSFPG